jgi:hypothetical protein
LFICKDHPSRVRASNTVNMAIIKLLKLRASNSSSWFSQGLSMSGDMLYSKGDPQ